MEDSIAEFYQFANSSLIKRMKFADIITILGRIDIIVGEVDC